MVRLGQVRLGQVRLGQVRLGQDRIGQVRLGQVRLGQVRLGQVRFCQDRLGQARFGLVWFGLVWFGLVRLGFFLSYMKKIEDLYFTVSIILSSAQNFEQLHFFLSTARTHVRHTFFLSSRCHFSVEQSRFLKKVLSSRDSSSCISSS